MHEPSGMQLIMHLIVTLPVTLATSFSFYVMAKQKLCSHKFWIFNAIGLGIPVMSVQTGITYFHFDIAGLLFAGIALLGVTYLYVNVLVSKNRS